MCQKLEIYKQKDVFHLAGKTDKQQKQCDECWNCVVYIKGDEKTDEGRLTPPGSGRECGLLEQVGEECTGGKSRLVLHKNRRKRLPSGGDGEHRASVWKSEAVRVCAGG